MMMKIKVPATTANFGPGFDAFGLALNLYQYILIEKGGADEKAVLWDGTPPMAPGDNYVLMGLEKTLEITGRGNLGYRLTMLPSEIPMERGLGSSAAAIVSGVMAANYLMDMALSKEKLAEIATELEGHPDNVIPAITGGMTITAMDSGRPVYAKINFPADLALQAFIPDFTFSTEAARKALPKSYSQAQAVHNISRAGLLVHALHTGEYNLLKTALSDSLHEPYRLPLIADAAVIMEKIGETSAYGKFLSGAGPVLMALTNAAADFQDEMALNRLPLENKWRLVTFQADGHGATYEAL